MSPPRRSPLALAADVLTSVRLLLAAALVPVTWSGAWTAAGLLVAAAWTTDFADGRLARRAGGPTRLGGFDMTADTAVGVGLILGLMGQGSLPVWAGVGALAVFGPLYLLGNLAASMLLQLTGYLPLLAILWNESPPAWWLPMAVAVGIGVLDWRRLLLVNIPAFLRGLGGRFEHRPRERADRGP